MNKIGMVFGIAAVATLAGCKDPDYSRGEAIGTSQNEVKNVETAPAQPVPNADVAPAPQPQKCQCPPGTKHTKPCACGLPNCTCVVDTRPVASADLSKKPAAEEYTTYIVQNGDYLAKISKKYNVTISSIKRLNPSIKKDVIWVGQKLKLPGKIDVGVQEQPKKATAASAAGAASAKPLKAYTGPTKDYVVKSGDTLGSIAYGNGITIRQLKALNGLSSDALKVGQKLKIPAEKVVAAAKPPAKKDAAKVAAEDAAKKTAASEAAAPAAAPAEPAAAPAEPAAAPVEEKKPEAAQAFTTYVVKEGEDVTAVSIAWGVSASQIREINNMAEGDQLTPGQIIKLPADAQR